MASILKQLEQFKEITKICSEFNDLVSIVDLAKMKGEEDSRNVRDFLESKGVKHVGKLGSVRMYKKSEVLEIIKNNR